MLDRGVYLNVFEQSVLANKTGQRPLSFLASVSAELVVVSALILIPLAYNDHLPAFHWRSVGVGAPLKPTQPPSVPVQVLRHASSGTSFPRPFVPSSLPRIHDSSASIPGPISWKEPYLELGSDVGGPRGSAIIDISAHVPVAEPPARRDPAPLTKPSGPVRVSAGVQSAKLIKKVVPEYPPLAKAARISGVVHLIGIIGRDGTIRNLQLVSGHPLLAHTAMEAVAQWVYRPTLLSGEAVEVIAPIDVYFTLGQ